MKKKIKAILNNWNMCEVYERVKVHFLPRIWAILFKRSWISLKYNHYCPRIYQMVLFQCYTFKTILKPIDSSSLSIVQLQA